ncbi:MAG: putative metallo-hydrolase YycJ [Tenericutes bacterium ADurb.BinA124]|nr:MAG: putative metallo-hydrolase YycJ [Tenericutes bacterium ADurb.BinA124]
MIECGIQFKKIQQEIDLPSLTGCLISHEHKDHAKSCKEIARYAKVYGSLGTLQALDFGAYAFNTGVLTAEKQHQIGTFTVVPFGTEHDAKEPMGFLVYSKVLDEKLLFATDTYYIRPTFRGLDYIMIECNYQTELLKHNLAAGSVSSSTATRLFSSHFELQNVKKFLSSLDLTRTKRIYLLHLSEKNANAEQMKREIMELTGKPVEICKE